MENDHDLDTLSGLIRELHRGAGDECPEDFRAWAMRQLQTALPFDSGLWADGQVDNDIPEIHSVYLLDRPMEMLADYEQIKQHDIMVPAIMREPGRAVTMVSLGANPPEPLAAYVRKWKLLQIMSTLSADSLTALLTAISLFRDDGDRPFTEAERQLFEQAYPHLQESYAVNRILQLVRATLPANAEAYSGAVADTVGCLKVAPGDFVKLVRGEWPEWRGPHVPVELKPLLETPAGARFVGRRILVKSTRADGAVFLQARTKRAADELTTREVEVAEGFARGLTAKQVARELGVAPPTIRSHLAAMFKKLGVKDQTQMVWEIRSAE